MMCLRGCLHPAALFGGARKCAPFLLVMLTAAMLAKAQTAWSDDAIRDSRRKHAACTHNIGTSLSNADLIVALRDGGQELLLLDAATLFIRASCHLPQPLEGTPLRAADGRALYLPAAHGWVMRLDLEHPQTLVAVRTGHELRGLALSADGRWLLAGHARPHSLVLLDSQLQLVRTYRTAALAGGADSAISGVWHSEARKSFMVAFETLPELWELSYDPAAEPIYDGLVHDYRMAEAIATRGFLGVRRTPLQQALQVILADAPLRHLLGTTPQQVARDDAPGTTPVQIVNMDIRRSITTRTVPGRPLAWAGIAFTDGAASWLVWPTEPEGRVVLMNTADWQVHPEWLASVRGVFAVRSHRAAAQLWLHATTQAPSDTLVLVDKRNLQVLATLRKTGRSWVPVSFAADGRRAVLATRGAQGDVRLLDTGTLRELRRTSLAQVGAVFALDGPRPYPKDR